MERTGKISTRYLADRNLVGMLESSSFEDIFRISGDVINEYKVVVGEFERLHDRDPQGVGTKRVARLVAEAARQTAAVVVLLYDKSQQMPYPIPDVDRAISELTEQLVGAERR